MALVILTSTKDTYVFDPEMGSNEGSMGKVYKAFRASDVRFAYERGAITGSAPEIVKLPRQDKNRLYRLDDLKNSNLNIPKFKHEFNLFLQHTLVSKTALKPVALKVLFSDLATNPMYVQRFQRESQIIIKHPNIVEILDYIVIPGEKKGGRTPAAKHHIVMEYLNGENLDTILDRLEKPLHEKVALGYTKQILEGLHALHAKMNITHRDLKPSNLMILHDDTIKILDFGVAKLDAEHDDAHLTNISTFIGTPAYASPEQMSNIDVGHHTDLWALGIILYQMLTKNLPFEGGSAEDTKRNILSRSQITPKIPAIDPLINDIISKATQKDIDKRYTTAEAFLKDVMAVLYAPETGTVSKPQNKKPPTTTPKKVLWDNSSQKWGVLSVIVTLIILLFFFILSQQ